MTFPHGECQCRGGCGCATTPGPASIAILRGNETLHVCTKCKCSGDTLGHVLLTPDEDVALYVDYDAFGFFVLCGLKAPSTESGDAPVEA